MADDLLLALVRRYVRLSETDAAQISAAWGLARVYKPGARLLSPGQVCRALYFMDVGYARFYTETPDGLDLTRHFALPGHLFTVSTSFSSALPSREGLQVLTEGRVRQLSTEANAALAAVCPTWNVFRQAYIRAVYAYLDQALDAARYLSAKERYETFARDYPNLLLHVPLRYVASYLGMTPQSMSRVRAQS